MSERSTKWSLTINNPTEEDWKELKNLPAGWEVLGQPEVGAEGTEHLQLMVKTPQVRFSALKKHFKRGHIEVAKNAVALAKYVQKEDTRNGEAISVKSEIPTLFEYQTIIAKKWVEDEYQSRVKRCIQSNKIPDFDEIALCYIDSLVASDIEETGRRGAEFIAINPMWRASWRKFWRSIIKRDGPAAAQARTSEEASVSPPAENDEADQWSGGVCIGEADT